MAATLIRVDRNGTKYYEGDVPCDRCGGAGSSKAWQFTGFTCYKCGGTGKVFGKWIERTPEYEAKLQARRMAKTKAYQEDHKEEIERRKAENEKIRIIDSADRAFSLGRKATSHYICNVGDKLNITAVYDHRAYYDFRLGGWAEERMYIHTFRDICGNTIVWKTTSNAL